MFLCCDFFNISLWVGVGLVLGVYCVVLVVDGKGVLFVGESLCICVILVSGEQILVIGVGIFGSFVVEIGLEKYWCFKEVMVIFFNSGVMVFDILFNYGGVDKVLGVLLEEGGWWD